VVHQTFSCPGGADALLDWFNDLGDAHPLPDRGFDAIAGNHSVRGLDTNAVDVHMTADDPGLRSRPRLIQAHRPHPAVDPRSGHEPMIADESQITRSGPPGSRADDGRKTCLGLLDVALLGEVGLRPAAQEHCDVCVRCPDQATGRHHLDWSSMQLDALG